MITIFLLSPALLLFCFRRPEYAHQRKTLRVKFSTSASVTSMEGRRSHTFWPQKAERTHTAGWKPFGSIFMIWVSTCFPYHLSKLTFYESSLTDGQNKHSLWCVVFSVGDDWFGNSKSSLHRSVEAMLWRSDENWTPIATETSSNHTETGVSLSWNGYVACLWIIWTKSEKQITEHALHAAECIFNQWVNVHG